jgi:predicted nucleotidyltransferase
MIATSFDLSGKLDPLREHVFRDVAKGAAACGVPFFIVGACARDLLLDLYYGLPPHRATNDIDFGIRISSWSQFDALINSLIQTGRYTVDFNRPQRLRSTEGAIIDVIPFGGVEDSITRDIAWPPDYSTVMSAVGFEEAYRNAISVRFAPDLVIAVSSLAGMALMKLISWKERRNTKDAKDLKLIISEYLRAGNELRLESGKHRDLLDEEKFISVELASARLLGRDLTLIMTDQSRQVVLGILNNPSELASGMSSEAIEIDEAFESAQEMLKTLRQGIEDL